MAETIDPKEKPKTPPVAASKAKQILDVEIQQAHKAAPFVAYVLPEGISPVNHGQVRTALVVNRLDDGRLNLCVFVGDPNDLARTKDQPMKDNNGRIVATQVMFGVGYRDPATTDGNLEGTWHEAE